MSSVPDPIPSDRDTLPAPEQAAPGTRSHDSLGTSPGHAIAPIPQHIGRFEVRRFIGEGAFGRVYEAHDPSLRRTVALKVAKSEHLHDEKRVERFLREAQAAATLLHPSIVAVFDYGQDGPHSYIASAFIAGTTLSAALAAGKMPIRTAVAIVRKLAEALAYAHRHGVIHRDIKPLNVMLTLDGEPALMDFGLASRAGELEKLTLTGQFMGTPEYAAPEQWQGRAEASSDQYSLGCVFFELLTNRLPFEGKSIHDQLIAHTQQQPPPLRQFRPEVPHDLETICLKCLEKEPGRRYPDCQALADDLRRWQEGEPVLARPPGPFERALKWTRRNPLAAALAAAMTLTLVLGATTSGVLGYQASEQARRARNQAERADQQANLAREETARAEREASEVRRLIGKEREARLQAERSEQAVRQATGRAETALSAIRYGEALRAWREHDVMRAENLLDEIPLEQQRTWECRHLRGLCRQKLLRLEVGKSNILDLCWSPDGSRLLAACQDSQVRIWDTVTGKLWRTLSGHRSKVISVACSPDASHFVSGDEGGVLIRWSLITGHILEQLDLWHVTGVSGLAYSADGRHILSTPQDGTLRKYDWRIKQVRDLPPLRQPLGLTGLRLSPDGRWAAAGWQQGGAVVWDLNSQQVPRTVSTLSRDASDLAWAPDGRSAAITGENGSVRIYDVRQWTLTRTLRSAASETSGLSYHPAGRYLAVGGDDRIVRIWDATNGQEVSILTAHPEAIRRVAYSPCGYRLAVAGAEDMLVVWQLETTQELLALPAHPRAVRAVDISPDGKTFLSGAGDETVRICSLSTGNLLHTLVGHTGSVRSARYSHDGKWIVSAAGDDTIRIWDVATGKERRVLRGHTDAVLSVCFSPDDGRIVSTSADRTMRMWNAHTGELLYALQRTKVDGLLATWAPEGSVLASVGKDRLLVFHDTKAGKPTIMDSRVADPEAILALEFSRDGKSLVTGSADGNLKIWDTSSRQLRLSFQGHRAAVRCVGFSGDGSRIFSGGDDRNVKVWDALTGQELLTLSGHAKPIWSLRASRNGKYLVTGSEDGSVKVWQGDDTFDRLRWTRETPARLSTGIQTDEQLHLWMNDRSRVKLFGLKGQSKSIELLGQKEPVWDLVLSPDGKQFLTIDASHHVAIWDREGQRKQSYRPHTRFVMTAKWSPDSTRIVSAGDDRTILVWNARTGSVEQLLTGHSGCVSDARFSPDGKQIVSASTDGTVRVWDASTGEVFLTKRPGAGWMMQVQFTPRGDRILAVDEFGKFHAWDVSTGDDVPPLLGRVEASLMRADLISGRGYLEKRLQGSNTERLIDPGEASARLQKQLLEYHRSGTLAAERAGLVIGGIFHLDRLLELNPSDRELWKRRDRLLALALQTEGRDRVMAIALARQALLVPESVEQRIAARALSILRQPPDTLEMLRLRAGLYSRIGMPKEAVGVCQQALRQRQPEEAPVEELLLALAWLDMRNPREARLWFDRARYWQDRSPQIVKGATLAGLAGSSLALFAGPLDLPLKGGFQPMAAQTAQLMRALLAEVEARLEKEPPFLSAPGKPG